MAGSTVEEVFVLTARDNTSAAFSSVKRNLMDVKKAFTGLAAGFGVAGLSELASGSREAAAALGTLSAAAGFLSIGSPLLAGVAALAGGLAFFVGQAREARQAQEELTKALEDYGKTAQQLATAPYFEKALKATERITELEEEIANLRESSRRHSMAGAGFFADRATKEADVLEAELARMISLRQNAYNKMREVRHHYEKEAEEAVAQSERKQTAILEQEQERRRQAMTWFMDYMKDGMDDAEKAADERSREVMSSFRADLEDAIKGTDDWLKETSAFADQAARNMQSAFANFLFDPFKDGLDGLLKNFLQVIQRMIAEAAAARIFEAMGFTGTGGGVLGSALSGLFGGKRAAGGPVSAGKAYLVGEEGPEMFKPGVSGTIVPNGAGGGMSVVVNIDARNATDPAAIMGAGMALRRQLQGDMATFVRRGYFP